MKMSWKKMWADWIWNSEKSTRNEWNEWKEQMDHFVQRLDIYDDENEWNEWNFFFSNDGKYKQHENFVWNCGLRMKEEEKIKNIKHTLNSTATAVW